MATGDGPLMSLLPCATSLVLSCQSQPLQQKLTVWPRFLCRIVVDADSKFLGTFEEMCMMLGLCLHAAAHANHKAILVERFFCSLNKAVTTAAND
jgi:hypothetical protein